MFRHHRDVLAGLVVAFAMIPEAIAFSGIAGVDPRVGLFGAFILAVTLAVVGGRGAMITSATGSLAASMRMVSPSNKIGFCSWSPCCTNASRSTLVRL